MTEILKTLPFDDLPTKPALSGRPRISDDLQQTLALLSGWDESTRRLIRVSPSGVLSIASPTVKGIQNILADSDAYTSQGGDIPTTEIMVRANPDNNGRIWLNVGVAAAVNVGYPLDGGEWVTLSINNLVNLYFYIALDTEKATLVYTK